MQTTPRRTALTLSVVPSSDSSSSSELTYYTMVSQGHASARTSADSDMRRAFRSLAKRMVAGRLRQMTTSPKYGVFRHGPARSVEMVEDSDSAILAVFERQGYLRVFRTSKLSTPWKHVGTINLLGLVDGKRAECRSASCDGRRVAWVDQTHSAYYRSIGLSQSGRLALGLEARLENFGGSRIFPADAGNWLAGPEAIVYASHATAVVVADTFDPETPPHFASVVATGPTSRLFCVRNNRELVEYSPPSRISTIGICQPSPNHQNNVILDFKACSSVAVLLWKDNDNLCVRAYDVERRADLLLSCAVRLDEGQRPSLLLWVSHQEDEDENENVHSRRRSRKREASWSVGVVESRSCRSWTWSARRREEVAAANFLPKRTTSRVPFEEDEPLSGLSTRSTLGNGEASKSRYKTRQLREALAEANRLALQCAFYPRRANSRSKAPSPPMPRQRAAALAAALDLPRESLSRPASFATMLFLCRSDPTDPCYGCFELLCHLHLSLEPEVLPSFIRGVVQAKQLASEAARAASQDRWFRRRSTELFVGDFDDSTPIQADDQFSEVGAFSETEDTDDSEDSESDDFLFGDEDEDDDFYRSEKSGPSIVPWPPIVEAPPPRPPSRAVSMIVPLRRRSWQFGKPSFETRAAAAIPPLSTLTHGKHRAAALGALRAANHHDLAVEALLAAQKTKDAVDLVSELRGSPYFDDTFAAAIQRAMRDDDVDTVLAVLKLQSPDFTWRDLHNIVHDLLDEPDLAEGVPTAHMLKMAFLHVLPEHSLQQQQHRNNRATDAAADEENHAEKATRLDEDG